MIDPSKLFQSAGLFLAVLLPKIFKVASFYAAGFKMMNQLATGRKEWQWLGILLGSICITGRTEMKDLREQDSNLQQLVRIQMVLSVRELDELLSQHH
jgi:hypothetical protein